MFFSFPTYCTNTAVITDRGESLSYQELGQLANGIVEHIHAGAFVFTLCENTLGSLVGYVSMLNHHRAQVLLDGEKGIDILTNLAEQYLPDYFWAPTVRIPELLAANLIQDVPLCSYADYALFRSRYEHTESVNPDLLLCLTTSGSTGSPKFVRLSQTNLLSNTEAIAEYLSIDENERPITSLPMYYSFGMSVINSNLLRRATILLTDKAVVQREFWSFLKENEATSLAGVPYTYETLRMFRFFRMNLPHLKTMIQAGGKLNAAIVAEYAQYAKDNDKRFFVMYGQTEAAPRISYLPYQYTLEKNGSIGIAVPGGRIALIDSDGNEINSSNIDGELVYYGPNVCMGYAENRFDLSKGDENHGCLHTGDVARRDEDGFFYITGRMNRFVKVWGNRCNLDAIEQIVKSITPQCACVGEDDHIIIVIMDEKFADEVLCMVASSTRLNPSAFEVKVVDEIPVFESGKINYKGIEESIK